MELTGRITKGVGSFYTIVSGQGEYVSKARGRFRREGATPLPGDYASFELGADGKGYLTSLHPRKNQLVRPAVANVDKLFIVISASLPRPDYLLVDKLLVQCALLDIAPVLIINKCDEAAQETVASIAAQYSCAGCRIIQCSAHTGRGTDAVRSEIAGCFCCFAGQSAVGKSSLMNALAPQLMLRVGGLSERAGRGRHTTRHAELWSICGGMVADTPGFSLLDTAELEAEELAELYHEMKGRRRGCRFPGCLHLTEPGCAVKPLVGESIPAERYGRYSELIKELKERRKHRYD